MGTPHSQTSKQDRNSLSERHKDTDLKSANHQKRDLREARDVDSIKLNARLVPMAHQKLTYSFWTSLENGSSKDSKPKNRLKNLNQRFGRLGIRLGAPKRDKRDPSNTDFQETWEVYKHRDQPPRMQ